MLASLDLAMNGGKSRTRIWTLAVGIAGTRPRNGTLLRASRVPTLDERPQ